MKENVTSQEALIEMAKRVLLKEGVDALSIRRLARECGISVGVFYNYFESKADLVFTIVSEFWQDIMQNDGLMNQDDVCEFVKTLYNILVNKLEEFENTWLMQISLLDYSEKEKGKELEHLCFSHMIREIIGVIENDKNIKEGVFNEVLTQEAFAHFVLMNIVSIAKNQHRECNALIEIIKRVLYK